MLLSSWNKKDIQVQTSRAEALGLLLCFRCTLKRRRNGVLWRIIFLVSLGFHMWFLWFLRCAKTKQENINAYQRLLVNFWSFYTWDFLFIFSNRHAYIRLVSQFIKVDTCYFYLFLILVSLLLTEHDSFYSLSRVTQQKSRVFFV